jgi:hypothetical protein
MPPDPTPHSGFLAGFRRRGPDPRALGSRRADVKALQIADPLGAQQGRVRCVFDALGNRAQAETLGEAEQVTQKDPIFRSVREVSDKRTVDLDRVHSQALQMSQRRMSGAEIIERDTAPSVTQGIDEPGGFLDVAERRRLGDFDNHAPGEMRPVAQPGTQDTQPRPVASGQPRHVEAELNFGMGAEFLHRSFEDEAIDQANQTEVLDGRDELGTWQDVSRLVTYPQQALEVIDDPRRGAHYRLISKQQAVLVQRGFYLADYRRIAPLSAVRDIPVLVHLSGASAFLRFTSVR